MSGMATLTVEMRWATQSRRPIAREIDRWIHVGRE
jgi:hypothetical protein